MNVFCPLFNLAAALVLTLVAGCSKPAAGSHEASGNNSIPVTVAKVEVIPMDRTLTIVGTLYPKDDATIAAQVEGQVEKTLVDFGDRVTAGQELAMIDTATYEANARQADANLARAQATATNAEQGLKRADQLRKENIASSSELDQATADANQALAGVKAAEAAQAIARLNLERSHVIAPFDGAISRRDVGRGDFAMIASPLFKIVNDAVLKFIFQVPERYGSFVQKGLAVTFNVDNYPGETFQGRVYLIGPAASTASRAFNVGALVTNTDFRLKANAFARGELVLQSDVQTTVVPVESIISFAGVTKVFVIEGTVARSRQVSIGRVHDGLQEITNGLKAGELVVTTGQTKLTDGAAVTVQNSSTAAATQSGKRNDQH